MNGSIQLGEDSSVEGLSSVNGSVKVGEGAVVDEEVESVNGSVSLDRGARAESVTTVNGRIKLRGADVERNLMTINGDIALTESARVGGDIVIEDRGNGSSRRERPLRIELEGGSTVEGNVLVEDKRIEVELYLRDGSRVLGRVEGAKLIEE